MEHVALYRQFRPMNFDEIVEQKAAVASLRQSVITGRIGHAYLFCGQRGTGKTSIARVFSRAINCENPVNGNPCNSCPTCKGILNGSLMDVIEIDAASNTSVDNIRKISEEVNFAPSRAPHKVYIIDEVHMISAGAFNALLKTLEEPPAHAVFLFATTEPHRIPATVLSRCQRYNFKRISTESIASRLRYICNEEKINANDEALRLIASISDGAMRDAISVLDQVASAANGELITPESIENITGTVDTAFLAKMTKVLLEGKFDDLMPLCAELADSGSDITRFALDLAEYFRKLLIIRVVPNPTTLISASASVLKEMYTIASSVSPETLVAFISSLSAIVSDLKWSPSVRTSFEIGLIRLCGRKVKAEVVPLTIPEFDKIQAKEAAKIIVDMNKPIEAVVEQVNEVATVKDTAPATTETPVKESTSEVNDAPATARSPFAEVKAKLEQTDVKDTPVKEDIPVVEAVSEPISTPVADIIAPVVNTPSDEAEEDPDDKPIENQMDLFSMVSAAEEPAEPAEAITVTSATSEEEPEAKVEPSKPANSNKVFANLSSSFLDDMDMPYDNAPAPSAPSVDSSATSDSEGDRTSEPSTNDTRAWETSRSSLATALDETPIATIQPKKEPEAPFEYQAVDTDAVWSAIIKRVESEDYSMYVMLSWAEFRIMGDGAYIVYEDDKRNVIDDLKSDPNYRKVSSSIKNSLKDIQHVYMCTETMYQNMLKKSGSSVKKSISKAEELINKSKQLGIDTEIHFGDN